jgi:serine/threonine protein kinase
MSLETFKMILETLCKTGEISEEDRQHLYAEGRKIKLSKTSVDHMIGSQLKFAKGSRSVQNQIEGSGFLLGNEESKSGSGFVIGSSDETANSGFTMDNDIRSGFTHYESFSSSKFTNERILSESDQGAMSIVSEARQGARYVIIKRLKTEHKNDPQRRDLFFKESEFCRGLQHENIVSFIESDEDDRGPYFYMENINGETLEKKIASKKLTPEEIKSIARKILSGLDYLHDKGFIHRDLKPGNIMIGFKTQQVKLIDLGLAYSEGYVDSLLVAGTPKYMAPEMSGSKSTFNKTTDIYSFGLILLEMFTKSVDPKKIDKIKPLEWQSIISKCIQKEYKMRYQTCDALITDIEKIGISPGGQAPLDKDKFINKKLDEYFEDGIFLEQEEKLLYFEAKEIDYPLDKLKLLIEKRLAEEDIKLKKNEETKIQKQKEEESKLKLKEESIRLTQIEEVNKQKGKKEELQLKLVKEKEITRQKRIQEIKTIRGKKKKEAIDNFDKENGAGWIVFFFFLGVVPGIIFCILHHRGFFAYILIPIFSALVSTSFTLLISAVIHLTSYRFQPVFKIIVVFLYLILAYSFCRGFSGSYRDLSSLWIWIKSFI